MVILTPALRRLGLAILPLAAFASAAPVQPAPPPADLVLLDARILTVDEAFRTATALAVRDGRFAAIGSNLFWMTTAWLTRSPAVRA